MAKTLKTKRTWKQRLGALLSIALLGAGTVVMVSPEQSHAASAPKPYATTTITKVYDGTGHGTAAQTFVNENNGYVPGDNDENDGVVASGDFVGYKVETKISGGVERDVEVLFDTPPYLKLEASRNKDICGSNTFAQGKPIIVGDVIKGCTYHVKQGAGVTFQHALTATALDTAGRAEYDQVLTVKTGLQGQGSYSSYAADDVTVVSAPSADLVLRPSTCTVDGTCEDLDSYTKSGYLEVMVDPLKWPGYSDTKGMSTKMPWTVDLDVSGFPACTVWSVDGKEVGKGGSVFKLGEYTGNKQVKFDVSQCPNGWGDLEDGETRSFDAHIIVPEDALSTSSYLNNASGWEPGQGQDSGHATDNECRPGAEAPCGSSARPGYLYPNNDWTQVNVFKDPDGTDPGGGGECEGDDCEGGEDPDPEKCENGATNPPECTEFPPPPPPPGPAPLKMTSTKVVERPWNAKEGLWQESNIFFNQAPGTTASDKSTWKSSPRAYEMVPSTELTTTVKAVASGPEGVFVRGLILSDELEHEDYVEFDEGRQVVVSGPNGTLVAGFTTQWSATAKGAQITDLASTGWIDSDWPVRGARAVRVVFDGDIPAGTYSVVLPTRVRTLDALTAAKLELPKLTSDTMRTVADVCKPGEESGDANQIAAEADTPQSGERQSDAPSSDPVEPVCERKTGSQSVQVNILDDRLPKLGLSVTARPGAIDHNQGGKIDFTLAPTVSDLARADDAINGELHVQLDACINDFTLPADSPWEIVGEKDLKYSCGDTDENGNPVTNDVTFKLKSDWLPSNSFSSGTAKVPPLVLQTVWSKLTDKSGTVTATWTGLTIAGNQETDPEAEATDYATVTAPQDLGAGQEITTSTPLEEIEETLKFQPYILTQSETGKVPASSTIIVMPGRGNDAAYFDYFDDYQYQTEVQGGVENPEEHGFTESYEQGDKPKQSNFHGDYQVARVQVAEKDSVAGTKAYCTTQANPSLDLDETAGYDWKLCQDLDKDTLGGITAVRVDQPGEAFFSQLSVVDIELQPTGNQADDNYLMWIGLVTGEGFTGAGIKCEDSDYPECVETAGMPAWPVNDRIVSSTISGYVYWDIWGRGDDRTSASPGIDNITVELIDEAGNVVAGQKVTTGPDASDPSDRDGDSNKQDGDDDAQWASGYYEFTNLHSGKYTTRVPDQGTNDTENDRYGVPLKIASAFNANKQIDVTQTYSFRGKKLGLSSPKSDVINLGVDSSQRNVNFGYYAPDPYSDLVKSASKVVCPPDAPNPEDTNPVCDISWNVTVKNGGTAYEPGGIRGAIGKYPGGAGGAGVWMRDGYYVVKSDGSVTRAELPEGAEVLGANGSSPTDSSYGSSVWTHDGYYVVKSDGSVVKADLPEGAEVLGANGMLPAASSYGSGVWTRDGYYEVKSDGSVTKAELPEGAEVLGAIGVYPRQNSGSGVWTRDAYYIVKSNGSVVKADLPEDAEILGATGSSPADSSGSGVWTHDGYYIVKSTGDVTKAKLPDGAQVLGAIGNTPASASSSYGSGVWTRDGYYIVKSTGDVTKAKLPDGAEVLGATGSLQSSGADGSGVWTRDGYYIVKSNGSVVKADLPEDAEILGAFGKFPGGSGNGSGVWTRDAYYIVKPDGSVVRADLPEDTEVLGATGEEPGGSAYGSGVWTRDAYYVVKPDGSVTKAAIEPPEAPEFTGTPETLTGGRLTDSTSKEVYNLEAFTGNKVVDAIGTLPRHSSGGGSGVLLSDGSYHIVSRTGTTRTPGLPEGSSVVQMIGAAPDAASTMGNGGSGSAVILDDGSFWVIDNKGVAERVQLPEGERAIQATGTAPAPWSDTASSLVSSSDGVGVVTESGSYYLVTRNYKRTGYQSSDPLQVVKVPLPEGAKAIQAVGDKPWFVSSDGNKADNMSSGVVTDDGSYYVVGNLYFVGEGSGETEIKNAVPRVAKIEPPESVKVTQAFCDNPRDKGVVLLASDGTGYWLTGKLNAWGTKIAGGAPLTSVDCRGTAWTALGTDGVVYSGLSAGNYKKVIVDSDAKVTQVAASWSSIATSGAGLVMSDGSYYVVDKTGTAKKANLPDGALAVQASLYSAVATDYLQAVITRDGSFYVVDFAGEATQVDLPSGVSVAKMPAAAGQGSYGWSFIGSDGGLYLVKAARDRTTGEVTQDVIKAELDLGLMELIPMREDEDGNFITREYQIPNLAPGEEVQVTLTGKVNRPNYESNDGKGLVIGNQAWETFKQTQREKPDLPKPALPEYDEDNPFAFGKWTGNRTCTAFASPEYETPGDQCDQVWASLPPTEAAVGSLSGYLWYDEVQDGHMDPKDERLVSQKVTLYKMENGVATEQGNTFTDETGYYEFVDRVPAEATENDGYFVQFSLDENPKTSQNQGTEVNPEWVPTGTLLKTDRAGATHGTWVWTKYMADQEIVPGAGCDGEGHCVYGSDVSASEEGTTRNVGVVAKRFTSPLNGGVIITDASLNVVKGTYKGPETEDLKQNSETGKSDNHTVTIEFTNNGEEPLKDLVISDQTVEGPALTPDSFACSYAGQTLTIGEKTLSEDPLGSWSAPLTHPDDANWALPVHRLDDDGETVLADGKVTCTATLPPMSPKESHADEFMVSGIGTVSGTPVTDTDEWGAVVEGLPSWTVSKSSDPDSGETVFVGEKITYTLNASNTGDLALTGLEVTDDMTDVIWDAKHGKRMAKMDACTYTEAEDGTLTLNGGTCSFTDVNGNDLVYTETKVGATLKWAIKDLNVRQGKMAKFVVTVLEGASGQQLFNNVTGDMPDKPGGEGPGPWEPGQPWEPGMTLPPTQCYPDWLTETGEGEAALHQSGDAPCGTEHHVPPGITLPNAGGQTALIFLGLLLLAAGATYAVWPKNKQKGRHAA